MLSIRRVDVDEAKRAAREAYEAGDYAWLSRLLEPAAVALVEACAPGLGDRVLDVAAGDGSAAIAVARRGACVTAVDLSPRQVQLGHARTVAAGLDVEWLEGDAEALPCGDGAFDVVLSSFGAIYAPRPELAVAEAFRAVRNGGVVGLSAWVAGGFNARLQAVVAAHVGQDGSGPEQAWATEAGCRALLGSRASELHVSVCRYERVYPSVEAMWLQAAQHVPPLVAIARSLGPDRFGRLGDDYRRVVSEFNRAGDGTLRLDVEYLLAVARR